MLNLMMSAGEENVWLNADQSRQGGGE